MFQDRQAYFLKNHAEIILAWFRSFIDSLGRTVFAPMNYGHLAFCKVPKICIIIDYSKLSAVWISLISVQNGFDFVFTSSSL